MLSSKVFASISSAILTTSKFLEVHFTLELIGLNKSPYLEVNMRIILIIREKSNCANVQLI